jgi:WD40 repeat protein
MIGMGLLSVASRLALQLDAGKSDPLFPASNPAQPAPSIPEGIDLVEWGDLEPGKGPVYGQDWSPDGRLIATADTDVVRLWDHNLRREIGVLAGHSDFIRDVAWSPAGDGLLASCSQDGSLRLWDAEAFVTLAAIESRAAICLAWEPSGRRLVVGAHSGELQIWQPAEQARLLCWTNRSHSPI